MVNSQSQKWTVVTVCSAMGFELDGNYKLHHESSLPGLVLNALVRHSLQMSILMVVDS